MTLKVCPLCGYREHAGRCRRPDVWRRWCGVCLFRHLPPPSADATPSAHGAANALLEEAGVRRTQKWCVRCGVPICPDHKNNRSPDRPRCLDDCRRRPEYEKDGIRRMLEIYVPDYLTTGPIRCKVCQVPVYKRELCSRHYGQFKKGAVLLHPEMQLNYSGERVVHVTFYLVPSVLREVRNLATIDGITVSRWVAEAVGKEVASRGVNLPKGPSVVWSPETLGRFKDSK